MSTVVMLSNLQTCPADVGAEFGLEDLLTEFEAIVDEARIRLAEEEAAA
ncbi:hypothetical protein ACUY4R_002172 [Kosakonia sp. BK9b]|nr:hypothetical protein [Kosakonia sp.]